MSDRGEPPKEEREIGGDGAEDELALCGGGVRDDEGARRKGKRCSFSYSYKRKAKQALLFPVKKFEKLCHRSSGDGESGKKRTPVPAYDAVGRGCILCFNVPPIPPGSPVQPDDPQKKPASYHDLVRSLLERNDFYSADCNVHRPDNNSNMDDALPSFAHLNSATA